MPAAKRIEVHVAPLQKWCRPEKRNERAPRGCSDLETLVRQHSPRRTCLSGSNDEVYVRCASAKRRPAHTMSRRLPMNRISCSGADPLQIHRSHCTSTAKGTGNASRLGSGPAAPARYRRSEGYPGWQYRLNLCFTAYEFQALDDT